MSVIGGLVSGILGYKAQKKQNELQEKALIFEQQQHQDSLAMQKEAIQRQEEAVQPLRELYGNIGQPGYAAAIKGLMSSFGFRPASQGVAGTSLGSTDTNMPSFVGDWGYTADLGRKMGVTTDQYQKAEQDISNREDLSPAMKMSLLTRIRMQQQSDTQNQMIDASRAGPMALLNALAPALNAGTAGVQGAQGIANTMMAPAGNVAGITNMLGNMANTAGQQGEAQVKRINDALAVLGNVFGQKQAGQGGSQWATGMTITPQNTQSGWVNTPNNYPMTRASGVLGSNETTALNNSVFGMF